MKNISIVTGKKIEFVDITGKINQAIDFEQGAALIFTPHTTCALSLNENETGLVSDMERFVESLVPPGNYLHDRIDNNAQSHLASLCFEHSLVLPVKDGRAALGTWQSVFLVELDGPRTRSVSVGKL